MPRVEPLNATLEAAEAEEPAVAADAEKDSSAATQDLLVWHMACEGGHDEVLPLGIQVPGPACFIQRESGAPVRSKVLDVHSARGVGRGYLPPSGKHGCGAGFNFRTTLTATT